MKSKNKHDDIYDMNNEFLANEILILYIILLAV